MIKRAALLLVLLLPGAALAQAPHECQVAQHQVDHIFQLPRVARAIADKKLNVLVVGSASSTLPGRNGAQMAYPARLQQALTQSLPGVAVKVATDVKSQRTAGDMAKTLKAALTAAKPALLVWQTGTVDAIQAVDPDRFTEMLEEGVRLAQAAGADIVLINSQYSPRTESMIALGTYADDLRWVALQHEIPLFNRYEIMKLWADLGTFDFTGAADKLEMAGRVHTCIGWLLADLITEAAKPGAPQTEGGR